MLLQSIAILTTIINHITTTVADTIMEGTTQVGTIIIMVADTEMVTTTMVDTDITMDIVIVHK